MKALEHHLYSRNGTLYYRIALPRPLHKYLSYKEIKASLSTQDLTLGRLYVAKLDIEIQSLFKKAYKAPDITTLQTIFLQGIEDAKEKAELPNQTRPELQAGEAPKLFSQIAKEYLQDCVTNAAKTLDHKRVTYEIFQSICGDMLFRSITKEEARKFKAIMLKTPTQLCKRKDFSSYSAIDWNNLPEGKTQSLVTTNNRITSMISLFAWAERNSLYEGNNPFSGLIVKNARQYATKRHPFSSQELATLFSCPIYRGSKGAKNKERMERGEMVIKDYWYWIPLIGLYTGMRLNEICQLLATDIQYEDGIWIINIDGSENKKIKTVSSRRKIPIHASLLDLGFIEHVRNSKTERLFPELPKRKDGTYSHKFTKRFSSTLKTLGLKRSGLCFHSFRHTFIDGLRNAGVEKSIAMKLVGHHSTNDIHSRYGYGHNLKVLQKELNKLSFLYSNNTIGKEK